MRIPSTPSDGLRENIRVQTVVIAELEFRDVQREIFAAHFVIAAHHAALNQRPETLNRVRVQRADNVLLSTMVNRSVLIFFAQVSISIMLICSEQRCISRNNFAHKSLHRRGVDLIEHAGDDITLTLDSADYGELKWIVDSANAAFALADMTILVLATDESFIDFNKSNKLAEFFVRQSGADASAHIPSGFVTTEAHHAMNLQSADTFLAGEHQMDDAEPIAERLICVLEDCPDEDREAVSLRGTLMALPMEFIGQRIDLCIATARAPDALAPAVHAEISCTGPFVRERFFPVRKGHLVNALQVVFGHSRGPVQSGQKSRLSGLLCQVRDNRRVNRQRYKCELLGYDAAGQCARRR